MCLRVIAVANVSGKVGVRALSEATGLSVTKVHSPAAGAMHFARRRGCSCSLLLGPADPESVTWQFDPEILDGLARGIKLMAVRGKGLVFQATWMGEEPVERVKVPLREFLRVMREGGVRNGCLYEVGRAG